MMNRRVIILTLLLAAGVLLTGCMNNGTTGVKPTATADFMPGNTNGGQGVNNPTATVQPTVTNQTGMDGTTGSTTTHSDGALTPFDWANNASQIEQAIARISEVRESRVVVTGTTALVGVKFDSVYKGQLTERIREMVAAEVMKADPSIQTVAVTSDEGDVQKVYSLSDQVRAGRTADELKEDINAIVRNATTLR